MSPDVLWASPLDPASPHAGFVPRRNYCPLWGRAGHQPTSPRLPAEEENVSLPRSSGSRWPRGGWPTCMHHVHCAWGPRHRERESRRQKWGDRRGLASATGNNAVHPSAGERGASEPQGAGRLAGAEGGERTRPPSCPPPPRLPVAGFRPEGGRRPGLPQSAFRTRSAALAEELLGTPAPSGEAGRGRDQAAAQGWSGGRPAAEQARGGYVPTRALSPATPPRQTTQASWLLTHLKF